MTYYLVNQVHEPDQCPAAQGYSSELWNTTLGQVIQQAGSDPLVKTHSLLVNGPEHRVTLVLEANDIQDITAFLVPIQGLGEAQVAPMSDLRTL